MQETWVQPLGGEGPLENEMATHSSILAWRIPWTEEPGGLQSMGLQRVGHDLATKEQQLNFITKNLGNYLCIFASIFICGTGTRILPLVRGQEIFVMMLKNFGDRKVGPNTEGSIGFLKMYLGNHYC